MKFRPPDRPTDLATELRRLQQVLDQPTFPAVVLDTLYAAPQNPVAGMVVLADGVLWNPGAGAGCYIYRGGAWNFMG